ncbi:MAG: hypothetical protein AB7P22_16945 [Vicinamibacterales bacterium]
MKLENEAPNVVKLRELLAAQATSPPAVVAPAETHEQRVAKLQARHDDAFALIKRVAEYVGLTYEERRGATALRGDPPGAIHGNACTLVGSHGRSLTIDSEHVGGINIGPGASVGCIVLQTSPMLIAGPPSTVHKAQNQSPLNADTFAALLISHFAPGQ